MDTRKTLPGLRLAQKYAVRIGRRRATTASGSTTRMLIKENHIAAAGGVTRALARRRATCPPGVWIQIEVENLEQLREALAAGAKMILLDNMNPDQMREAVRIAAGRAELEASGGITLENVRAIAETGVDRISDRRPDQGHQGGGSLDAVRGLVRREESGGRAVLCESASPGPSCAVMTRRTKKARGCAAPRARDRSA